MAGCFQLLPGQNGPVPTGKSFSKLLRASYRAPISFWINTDRLTQPPYNFFFNMEKKISVVSPPNPWQGEANSCNPGPESAAKTRLCFLAVFFHQIVGWSLKRRAIWTGGRRLGNWLSSPWERVCYSMYFSVYTLPHNCSPTQRHIMSNAISAKSEPQKYVIASSRSWCLNTYCSRTMES